MIEIPEINKARCFLVMAFAPKNIGASLANEKINAYMANPSRGLALFHDHFLGAKFCGGVVMFFVETEQQRQALRDPGELQGWDVRVRPLIFAHNPAAFDAQIAYTLKNYRAQDWQQLRQQDRPDYGRANFETETGQEQTDD